MGRNQLSEETIIGMVGGSTQKDRDRRCAKMIANELHYVC